MYLFVFHSHTVKNSWALTGHFIRYKYWVGPTFTHIALNNAYFVVAQIQQGAGHVPLRVCTILTG